MLKLDFKESLDFKDEAAFRSCQKTADNGCADAQLIVAKVFLDDKTGFIGQNTWFGMEYLFKASLSNADAKMLLAEIYKKGFIGDDKVLILKDRSYAYNLISQLVSVGNAKAEELIADIYCDDSYLSVHGMDKKYSEVMAFLCYEKSAGSGRPSATYKLAMMYKNGIGTKKSIELAMHSLILAAEKGYFPAIKELKENGHIYNSEEVAK